MPQTLLALLALILASLISYNQQRNSASSYRTMVQHEVEMAASGTLTHALELIGSRSFDEHSTPEGIHASQQVPDGEEDFTQSSGFGGVGRGNDGCDLMGPYNTPECDDIDDVHGLQNQEVVTQISDGRSLTMNVDLDVKYVVSDQNHTESTDPTLHKLVRMSAESEYLPYGRITVERVFSYDPIKAEAEYEQVYGPIGADPNGGEGCEGGGEIGGC